MPDILSVSQERLYQTHLCWDLRPVTACGLIVESQANPRTDWIISENHWTGPLGVDDVTCPDCLATVEPNTDSEQEDA